jgi:hypothetical protein
MRGRKEHGPVGKVGVQLVKGLRGGGGTRVVGYPNSPSEFGPARRTAAAAAVIAVAVAAVSIAAAAAVAVD